MLFQLANCTIAVDGEVDLAFRDGYEARIVESWVNRMSFAGGISSRMMCW